MSGVLLQRELSVVDDTHVPLSQTLCCLDEFNVIYKLFWSPVSPLYLLNELYFIDKSLGPFFVEVHLYSCETWISIYTVIEQSLPSSFH